MRKKILSFLVLFFLTVASAWAFEFTVTFTPEDLCEVTIYGFDYVDKEGVSLSASYIDSNELRGDPIRFTNSVSGTFTKIVIKRGGAGVEGDGWSGNTWTGEASSVSCSGTISDGSNNITIECTVRIDPGPVTITWNEWLLRRSGDGTYTYGFVTLACSNENGHSDNFFTNLAQNTFTCTLGKFTKIEIVCIYHRGFTGWTVEDAGVIERYPYAPELGVDSLYKLTWEGIADSVAFQAFAMDIRNITFTISPNFGNNGATSLNKELWMKREKYDDAWYDVNGRRIGNEKQPRNGLYIVNGKKVYVR